MDAACTIQDSIHVFSLVRKYVSRILGTYQAQKGFYLKQLAMSLIPIPPLEEQQRIVAKIEELLPYCDQLIK